MDEERIQDIRSIKKLLEDQNNLLTLRKAMPFMRPFLKLIKIDVSKIDESLEKIDEIKEQLDRLASTSAYKFVPTFFFRIIVR